MVRRKILRKTRKAPRRVRTKVKGVMKRRSKSRKVVGRRRRGRRLMMEIEPATQDWPRKRLRFSEGGGGGSVLQSSRAQEVSYSRQRSGKRRKVNPVRLMQLQLADCVYRFQGINRVNAATGTTVPGYYKMSLTPIAAGAGVYPLYMMNMTVQPAAAVDPQALYQMSIADNTDIIFNAVNGQNEGGTASSAWRNESSSRNIVNANGIQQTRYWMTDWFDIRLYLYGARAQDTYYDISLVTFKDDFMDPLMSPTAGEETNKRKSFYHTLVRSAITNPIVPGPPVNPNSMVVLQRARVKLAAGETSEIDTNPTARVHRMFYRDGKIRNHDWGQSPWVQEAEIQDVSKWLAVPSNTNNLSNNPHPKARVWLMIRCSNTTPVATASENRNDTPSFDLMVRRKVRINPPSIV